MNPEVAQFEALAKELLRKCYAEDEAEDLRQWLAGALAHLGGGDIGVVMTWPESFDLVDQMVEDYERIANMPDKERKVLSWPWQSWRALIDPLDAGMLGVVTAPDGQGKTIYAESIAEYWAEHKNKVVFVHYELNRKLMMLRRTSRHVNILARCIKEGKLDASQKAAIKAIRPRLMAWDGFITYVHTPGWSMERTISELTRLHAEDKCDAVVLDYLEKAAASTRQSRLFGPNIYQREADNVEQLKNFAETSDIPVLMVAQMSKAGKEEKFARVDRTDMRGAGEKSDKANLVVILKRERSDEGYSSTVDVLVDKNTMGSTGAFKQVMRPEFFQVGDVLSVSDKEARATAQPAREGGVR
jgi:replicative DNA helicase